MKQQEYILADGYGWRPHGTKISVIVVHSTANSTLRGVINWFMNPASRVSAHYVIDKDGRTVQMVPEHRRAWHAGRSRWREFTDVNDISIGIELVNLNNGKDPYPQEQIAALEDLCIRVCLQYNIAVEDIAGHKDVSTSGKTDPMGLDLEELRRNVKEELDRQRQDRDCCG